MTQSRKGKWLARLVVILAYVLLAEGASYLGLRILGLPTSFARPERSEKLPWGAWGKPNTVARHSNDCFDVPYRFNSAGARDAERSLQGKGRWVAIGDSFIEGYGLPEESRLTNLLEKDTGHEILNFSSSGNFGPLQYLIVYQQLASTYEHEGVIVGFLPDNDFEDNDPAWWAENRSAANGLRHRPYYVLSPDGNSFTIQYGVKGKTYPSEDFDREPSPPPETLQDKIVSAAGQAGREAWRQMTAHSSLLALTKMVITRLSAQGGEKGVDKSAGYFMENPQAARATELIMGQLAAAAGDRKKVLLVFPRQTDLDKQKETGKAGNEPFLAFLDRVKAQGWQVIDLSTIAALRQMKDVTLGCDGHWNAEASRQAASAIEPLINW